MSPYLLTFNYLQKHKKFAWWLEQNRKVKLVQETQNWRSMQLFFKWPFSESIIYKIGKGDNFSLDSSTARFVRKPSLARHLFHKEIAVFTNGSHKIIASNQIIAEKEASFWYE